jgi:hypothetical protein
MEVDIPDAIRPSSPQLSLFISAPANTYVTTNTFIRFRVQQTECIGFIIIINSAASEVKVRHFLAWEQLLQHLRNAAVENISFWPLQPQNHPPCYLYNSDITSNVRSNDIIGLACCFA